MLGGHPSLLRLVALAALAGCLQSQPAVPQPTPTGGQATPSAPPAVPQPTPTGGQATPTAPPTVPQPTPTGSQATPTAPPTETTVTVRDFAFEPQQVQLSPGGTVVWKFEGPAPHSSTADPESSEQWDSGVRPRGETYRRTFLTAGTYPYHCSPHASMKAKILVK